jgi:hypothetical protein
MEKLVRVVAMVVMYILITLYKRVLGKELETFLHYVHVLLSFFARVPSHSVPLHIKLTA